MTRKARSQAPPSQFPRRVLVALGILLPAALVAYFLWSVSHGLLVIFAGILFAILLDGIARVIRYYTPLKRAIALPLAFGIVALIIFGSFWYGGSQVSTQAPQLSRQLGRSLSRIHGFILNATPAPDSALSSQNDGPKTSTKDILSYGKDMIGNVTGLVTVTVSTITDAFIILILGIYFAIAPGYYLAIGVLLIPPRKRAQVAEVFDLIGHALRRWFLGRMLAMILVGVLTGLGLYALGVELAFLLAVIAGLFTFVPYLGALASAVPAMLVGLASGPLMTLYVAILFLAVHIIEGYIFSPLIQRRIVHVAPAFLLIAQLLAGLFAGVFGIFVATPLAIALTIGVQKFYIEGLFGESPHILGDETVDESAEESPARPPETTG